MENAQAIIGYLNETRERIGLAPVQLDSAGQVVVAARPEMPIGIKDFFAANPGTFKSMSAARWHLSHRETNGMKDMGACVEIPSKPGATKPRIAVFPAILIRWVQGERPWNQ